MLRKLISLALAAVFLLAVGSSTMAHDGRMYIPTDIEPIGDEHPWGGENNYNGGPSFDKAGDGSSDSGSVIDSGILTRLFGSVSFYGVPVLVHITLFSIDGNGGKDLDNDNDVIPTPPEPTETSSGSGDL